MRHSVLFNILCLLRWRWDCTSYICMYIIYTSNHMVIIEIMSSLTYANEYPFLFPLVRIPVLFYQHLVSIAIYLFITSLSFFFFWQEVSVIALVCIFKLTDFSPDMMYKSSKIVHSTTQNRCRRNIVHWTT